MYAPGAPQVMEALRQALGSLDNLNIHTDVFHPSGGGAEKMCKDMGVPLLGRVPLDPSLGKYAEQGQSAFQQDSSVACLPALNNIVNQLVAKTSSC